MATTTGLSWEAFLAAGKEGQRWECIDGEVRFMSPTGSRHGREIHLIDRALARWEDQVKGWVCFSADVAFTMRDGSWLCPDAAVVRLDRYPAGIVPEGPTPFPPDVAFEVISPSDLWADIQRKRRIYSKNGVVHVWVDSANRTIEVISPTRGSRTFAEGETAVIEELPGLKLDLFPAVTG
ncbi:MAG TPA: Uma2 family endonuclease [Terriglobia bacterium]|nr:Uma2 family endonuclease [Terriglobia bacterium]